MALRSIFKNISIHGIAKEVEQLESFTEWYAIIITFPVHSMLETIESNRTVSIQEKILPKVEFYISVPVKRNFPQDNRKDDYYFISRIKENATQMDEFNSIINKNPNRPYTYDVIKTYHISDYEYSKQYVINLSACPDWLR